MTFDSMDPHRTKIRALGYPKTRDGQPHLSLLFLRRPRGLGFWPSDFSSPCCRFAEIRVLGVLLKTALMPCSCRRGWDKDILFRWLQEPWQKEVKTRDVRSLRPTAPASSTSGPSTKMKRGPLPAPHVAQKPRLALASTSARDSQASQPQHRPPPSPRPVVPNPKSPRTPLPVQPRPARPSGTTPPTPPSPRGRPSVTPISHDGVLKVPTASKAATLSSASTGLAEPRIHDHPQKRVGPQRGRVPQSPRPQLTIHAPRNGTSTRPNVVPCSPTTSSSPRPTATPRRTATSARLQRTTAIQPTTKRAAASPSLHKSDTAPPDGRTAYGQPPPPPPAGTTTRPTTASSPHPGASPPQSTCRND